MANDSTYRVAGTNVPGCKLLYAQVLCNGVSTPTLGENYGKVVASVTRTGVGVYAIVFGDTYLAAGVVPVLRLATAADSVVQTKTFTVSTTKILTLTILTAGVAADIAADAGNFVELFIIARDGTAQ